MTDRLARAIIAVVVSVWVVTTVVLPFVVQGYAPPASVGVAMGSLAAGAGAFLFAKRADKRDANRSHGGKKKPRSGKPNADKHRSGGH